MFQLNHVFRSLGLFFLTALFLCRSVDAGIVSVSGATELVLNPPTSFIANTWESDTSIRVFAELTGVALSQPISIDISATGQANSNALLSPAVLPIGTQVESYYVHYDPVGTTNIVNQSGSLTFDSNVIGILIGTVNGTSVNSSDPNSLTLSTPFLGRPGFAYSDQITEFYNMSDSITLSADRRTVSYFFTAQILGDSIRIVTAPSSVPEPMSMTLVLSGLGCIFLRRSQRRS
jgi:hypothetical protein